jgi:hypothetical protein
MINKDHGFWYDHPPVQVVPQSASSALAKALVASASKPGKLKPGNHGLC